MLTKRLGLLAVGFIFIHSGCSSSSSPAATAATSGKLPLVTPIVKSAVPAGLGGTAHASFLPHTVTPVNDNGSGNSAQLASDVAALKSRFFSPSGPTEIVGFLLPQLDTLIGNVNTIAATSSDACLTQTPVAYNLTVPGGTVPMYAQCYVTGTASFQAATADSVSEGADPALLQFGIKNGVIYVYSANSQMWIGAVVTPNSAGTAYTIDAYLGVGYGNLAGVGHWDTQSYGLMHFNANSANGTFELAVAGIGLGFCGAQLVSDGTNIFAEVSNDMGQSCGNSGATDYLCVSATDGSTASSGCAGTSAFTLNPIGRTSSAQTPGSVGYSSGTTWGVTTYPAVANTTIDGTMTDALHVLGPITPTSGVGQLTSTNSGGGNNNGPPTVSQLVTTITTACPTITTQIATTAATSALAAYNSSGQQSDAITALNASLTTSGESSGQISCADTAVENN